MREQHRGMTVGRTSLLMIATAFLALAGSARAAKGSLKVDVVDGKSVTLSADDLQKMERETVKVTEHDGSAAEYTGVPLAAVLKAAGAPLDDKGLHGKDVALYVVATGSDGYKAVLSLTEADPSFGDRHVLVVDQRDGKPLADKVGPLRLVVPDDKRQGRWVRMLVSLEVKRAE